MLNKFFLIFILLCFSLLLKIYSQNNTCSPYSMFGIGELHYPVFTRGFSMGGLSLCLRSPFNINLNNPASFSAFKQKLVVIETGIRNQYTEFVTNSLTDETNKVSFDHFGFGFPVTKWWGASVGLVPYSNVGYKIKDKDTLANIGEVKYLYEGSGGINQFYIGNAFKMKNLSLGVNATYLFGTLNTKHIAEFPNNTNYFNTQITNSTNIHDFYSNIGLQYTIPLKNNLSGIIGISYGNQTNINVTYNEFAERFIRTSTDYIRIKDTITNVSDNKDIIVLPKYFGVGVSFQKKDKFVFGCDYLWQNWKKYYYTGMNESLSDSWIFTAGAEFTPDINAITNYWKVIRYRFGANYSKSYLNFDGQHLNKYGVTCGFGLPLKKIKISEEYVSSLLNLGFEFGEYGTIKNNLIKEKFIIISFGLTLNDIWFLEKKFD